MDIGGADIACMASPWLFGIGFIVAFSALFAKIHRLRKVMINAQRYKRIKVEPKDVITIMLVLLSLETAILLIWQLVAPLQWERTVLSTDVNGYPTKSVGTCQTSPNKEDVVYFLIPFCSLNMGCLMYALYLSFITKNLPNSTEGMWITASITGIFQVLLLGIPILIIVSEDTNAYYFARICLVFIMSMSVTLFIFLPKMYELQFGITQGRTTVWQTSSVIPNSGFSTEAVKGHRSSGVNAARSGASAILWDEQSIKKSSEVDKVKPSAV